MKVIIPNFHFICTPRTAILIVIEPNSLSPVNQLNKITTNKYYQSIIFQFVSAFSLKALAPSLFHRSSVLVPQAL